MTPADQSFVRQMIQQEMHKSTQRNKFNLSTIQSHRHTGLDSPTAFQPILNYIGSVGADGTNGILPLGWTVTLNGTGDYTVTHNLPADALYSVVVTPSESIALFQVTPFTGSFSVTMFSRLSGAQDTAFYFTLTVINNKSVTLPQYGGDQTIG